jgi:hypothetical protein
MAKAVSLIPIGRGLGDLLDYLTENLRCTKVVAACVMNEAYLDEQLQLEKQDLIRDGEPYGGWIPIDAKFGHIELDPYRRVRFVPRVRPWREARYRIVEGCDVQVIWPPQPPASQTAPVQRPEDEVHALKGATPSMIRNVIGAVYDDADKAKTKPPNINELPAAVQPRLKAKGYAASGRQIKQIGGEQPFKLRRLSPGKQPA